MNGANKGDNLKLSKKGDATANFRYTTPKTEVRGGLARV
jgi:hypothetical protein